MEEYLNTYLNKHRDTPTIVKLFRIVLIFKFHGVGSLWFCSEVKGLCCPSWLPFASNFDVIF